MTYAQSGVDIEAGDQFVSRIKGHVRKTFGPRVLGRHGGFAGCFRLDYNEALFKRNYHDPVLVSCTDGVGTKVKLATQLKIYDTLGQDLVAMSVNDLIVQGAEPLFFLDYLAVHKLDLQIAEALVTGVAAACVESGCALLGGETAEMPDVYPPGEFDMAGFAVGVCELHRIIDGSRVRPGDVILGMASSGVHSNGYSLVRSIVKQKKLDLRKTYPKLDRDRPLGQVLLTPTRLYAKAVVGILRRYQVKQVVSGMAHITGGGLPGNVVRVLGPHLNARINRRSWQPPAVFGFLQRHGHIDRDEMFRVFNMGIGYVMIVRPFFADSILTHLHRLGQDADAIGKITPGTGRVILR